MPVLRWRRQAQDRYAWRQHICAGDMRDIRMPRQQRNKPAAICGWCCAQLEQEALLTDTYTPVLTDAEIEQALDAAKVPEYPGCETIDMQIARAIERAAIEGYQQMISNPPETLQQIIAALRDLSERMKTVGAAMEYYGGFDGAMAQHGKEMVGAGMVADTWADGLERDLGSDRSDT